MAQHFGAGAHHFFQALVVIMGFFKRLAMAEGAIDGGEQLIALEGLEQVVVGAAAHGIDGDADVVNGGDHHHGKIGLQGVNAFEQRDAVDIVHHNVGEDEVEGVHLKRFEGFAAAVGLFHGVALALQSGGQHGAHGHFVVDHKNPRLLTRAVILAAA